MTGLLRTTLFFFLPVFAILLGVQIWKASRPTQEELKQQFLLEHSELVAATKAFAEKSLTEENSGRITMPSDLSDKGAIIAEVIADSETVLTLVDPELAAASTWKLIPTPTDGKTYNDLNLFSIQVYEKAEQDNAPKKTISLDVVFTEETIYQPDGNPAQLDLYIQNSTIGK